MVVLFYVIPYLFTSEADIYGLLGQRAPLPFRYRAIAEFIENLGQIAVVMFILWRSGDGFTRFGFKPFRFGRDFFGGIAILALMRVTHYLMRWCAHALLSHNLYLIVTQSAAGPGRNLPTGLPEFTLLGAMCLSSGFAQELIMRAFLITRLEELVDSTPLAVFLSTVLFIFYHGYEGYLAVAIIALHGVILAVIFCLFRRLAPLAIAHSAYNFIAFGGTKWL